MSDRNWDSVVKGVDSITWKIKNIYQETTNSISLGSKFYILPEKQEAVVLTEMEVDNLLEI